MGISATGQRRPHASSLRGAVVALTVLFLLASWLYAPPLTPGLKQAAMDKCNAHVGGNFRSYRLEWETLRLGQAEVPPHWVCWDAAKPREKAVSFGWFVKP